MVAMTTMTPSLESTPDDRVLAIARGRHGLITDAEARACGLSKSGISRRLHHGGWAHLHHGVYVVGAAPDTFAQRLLGRLLSLGGDAVASHRAAAHIQAIPGFGEAIEWSRPRGRSQRRPYGVGHGSVWLPAGHVMVRDGIPVTTVARTLFDLAGVVHAGRVERALDNALSRRLCTMDDVSVVFDDLARRGRRGTVVMREFLQARGPGYVPPNSQLEKLGRKVLGDAGIDDFEVEVDLGGDQEWVGRVDLLFERDRLVVELDSRTFHQSKLDRERDRQRDNSLMARGFRVLRVTWNDLKQHPARVVSQVVAARRASGPTGVAGSSSTPVHPAA